MVLVTFGNKKLNQRNGNLRSPSESTLENGGPIPPGPGFYETVVGSATGDKATSFFSPTLKSTRRSVYKKWAAMTLFLSTIIFCLLCLYWGALQHTNKNLPSLTIMVVDMDGQVAPYNANGISPMVGPAVTKVLQEWNAQAIPHLGYAFKTAADFNNDPKAVWRFVYDQHAWAAIVINANATTLLMQALTAGNATYDPMGAGQIIINVARDDSTYYNYIIPELTTVQTLITLTFGKMWAQQALPLLNTSTALQAAVRCPQAINPAIGFSMYNMRPFDVLVATPTVTVGLIYLIILSFFSFAFYMPIHASFLQPSEGKPLNFWQWIGWRIISTITAYFFLSLFYSLVSLSFRVPFSRQAASPVETADASRYGRATFFVYWMLNWVGTAALGLASENMGMLFGAPFFALWLIFWVISNVATSFYPIELAPGFFRYGFAWPLHNVVTATRTLIFDTHSSIGLNFGVLFAWVAVNLAFFPLFCIFRRWRTIKEKKAEAKKMDDAKREAKAEGRQEANEEEK